MTAGRTTKQTNQDWSTPHHYVDAVKRVFGGQIDLDPCSNPYSVVKARVECRLPQRDGLSETWNYETIYVNPPYGADSQRGTRINHWLLKCLDAHCKFGSEVIALVPVATNTGHWKHFVWGHATAIAFLYDTRLRFLVNGKDEGKGAPMSCAMIYWGSNIERFDQEFTLYGAVIDIRSLRGQPMGTGLVKRKHSFQLEIPNEPIEQCETASSIPLQASAAHEPVQSVLSGLVVEHYRL